MIPHFKQKPLAPSDRATRAMPKKTTYRLDPRTTEQVKRLLAAGKSHDEIAEIARVGKSRIAEIEGKPSSVYVKPKRNGTESYKPPPVVLDCTNRADCQCLKCRCEAGKTTEARLAMHREDELAKVDYFRAKQIGAR